MMGVAFTKSKNKYRVNNTYVKDLETACDQILDIFDTKKTEIIGKKVPFSYKKSSFMSYWYKNKPYFDIQHIISVLNLKKSSCLFNRSLIMALLLSYVVHKL